MDNDFIKIRGARVHNLKGVDVDIPIGKMTCISGPSGSGKSSLAFHTLYGESKRRYLNSFPNYLKFFSERPTPAEVDEIHPVLPAFGLHQINPIVGARSMCVDILGLTPLLQNYYYRYAQKICPIHKVELVETSIEKELQKYADEFKGTKFHLFIEKHKYLDVYSRSILPSYSYSKKNRVEFNQDDQFWEFSKFSKKSTKGALEQIKLFIEKGYSSFSILAENESELQNIKINSGYQCPECDVSLTDPMKLQYFSPYNALGACGKCSGHGAILEYDDTKFYNEDVSVSDGAVTFLKSKNFVKFEAKLSQEMKLNKWSTSKPLKDLPESFFEMLKNGGKHFCGLQDMITYLEKRKYKPHVRMLIRTLQKEVLCTKCHGSRLDPKVEFYGIKINNEFISLNHLINHTIEELRNILDKSDNKDQKKIADLLTLACNLGLEHLHLLRKTKSLSAGEYQRLLMMKYLSFDGTGSLFVFDEPSLGLSLTEQKWLCEGFQELINQGNTVVVVDHSKFIADFSDCVIYMGPGAGENGGEVLKDSSHDYLYEIASPQTKKIKRSKNKDPHFFGVIKPCVYGKVFPDIYLPHKKLSLISGKSGSGKTASVVHCLANSIKKKVDGTYITKEDYSFQDLWLPQSFKDVSVIDANLNRYTSRSSLGSMTGFASIVRTHFTKTAQAKSMGLLDGHFSSNSKLGQCEVCEGRGYQVIEMQFLEDVQMTCENCDGKRIEKQYAHVSDGYFEVWEAFEKPLSEVIGRIKLTPKYKNLWEYMKLLNLGYLSLSRTMMSLSGGERQRLYLLSKMSTKMENELLIFENLSFGLSARELSGVGSLLLQLVENGNTVVLIDQNPLFCDYAHYQVSF